MAAVVAERSIIVRAAPFTIGQIKETCGGVAWSINNFNGPTFISPTPPSTSLYCTAP